MKKSWCAVEETKAPKTIAIGVCRMLQEGHVLMSDRSRTFQVVATHAADVFTPHADLLPHLPLLDEAHTGLR